MTHDLYDIALTSPAEWRVPVEMESKSQARRITVQMQGRIDELEAEVERKDEALQRIAQWAEAYPSDMFPDQDMEAMRRVLSEAGYSLSALHGQWGRRIAQGIGEIARAALDPQETAP